MNSETKASGRELRVRGDGIDDAWDWDPTPDERTTSILSAGIPLLALTLAIWTLHD
jgi:hypothetical protein